MSRLLSMFEHGDRPELTYPAGPETEIIDCDLAVIGGGGAGLSAAVRASQLGAKVTVIEKMDALGGNSLLTGGLLSTNSKVQKDMGIADQSERYIKENYRFHKYTLDYRLVRRYIENTGTYFDWLCSFGVDLSNARWIMDGSVYTVKERTCPGYANDPAYGPGLFGTEVISLLSKQAEKLGVRCVLGAKATELITDENGSVRGLEADGQDRKYRVNAKTVLVASGGFGANEALLRRFLPQYFSTDNYISHYCMLFTTGDGIEMAEKVGAEVGKNISAGIGALAHKPGAYSLQRMALCAYPIMVNKNGRRFIAEDDAEDGEFAMDMQPEGLGYKLFDEKMKAELFEYTTSHTRFGDRVPTEEEFLSDIQRESVEGKLGISDTLEGLAKYIGCAPETLAETVEASNEMARAGKDSEFFKAPENMRVMDTPPYYALRVQRNFDVTMGGVSVNHRLEALRPDQSPIPGLYAAGDVASNWMGHEYGPMFSSFAFACNSGYLAGEEAVQAMKK